MEKKKVIVELSVLTSRPNNREVEYDLWKLCPAFRGLESGETQIEDVDIKSIE